MIRVTKGTIKADGEKFTPGDIIEGLSEKEEASLIAAKVAEPWGIHAPPVEEDKDSDLIEDLDLNSKTEKVEEEKADVSEVINEPEQLADIVSDGNEVDVNNGSADKIDIKFDAAAYVDGSADDKPRTRRK